MSNISEKLETLEKGEILVLQSKLGLDGQQVALNWLRIDDDGKFILGNVICQQSAKLYLGDCQCSDHRSTDERPIPMSQVKRLLQEKQSTHTSSKKRTISALRRALK